MRRVRVAARPPAPTPWPVALGALLWLASPGCIDRTAVEGEACTRSTECGSGLACVEGACSADLSPLADPSRVPTLSPSDAGEPMLDAGMTPLPDAGVRPPPGVDAGMMPPLPVADAAVTDAVVTTDAGGG